MWFSETVGCCAKGSRLCAVVSSLVFVIAAATADESIFGVFEPSPLYQGDGSCRYYDVVQHEPLTFNVTASCGSTDAYTFIVKKSDDYVALDGGKCINYGCTESCSLTCTAKDDECPTTTSYRYTIAAEFDDGRPLQDTVICVRVQNTAWVHFIGEQPSNLTSDDGRAELNFSADGYPQPLSYELSCVVLLPPPLHQSLVLLSSPTGNFTLVELPNGVTACTVVAYTGRRLAVTEPMAVLIRVNVTSLETVEGASSTVSSYSPAMAGISSVNSSLSASSSTTDITLKAAPVIQQDSVKGVHDEGLLAAITVPGVVVVISIALSVGLCIAFRRRRAALKGSPMISAESSVPTTPCQSLQSGPCFMPAPIINNSTINHNYYGDTYEINGPGSSVVIINEGVCVRSFPVSHNDARDADESSTDSYVNDGGCPRYYHMMHHDDRDADEPSTANYIAHVQEVGATCCQPTPILRLASASMLCSVELDNDETAVKYPIDCNLPQS